MCFYLHSQDDTCCKTSIQFKKMEVLIGQIVLFAGNFAPNGWALCDGQILNINQYTPLFTVLGTTYGGDGRNTFALPDLRSRVAVHPGQGPGLSYYEIGQRAGTESVTLAMNEIPVHSHALRASTEDASEIDPTGNYLAKNFDSIQLVPTQPGYAGGTGASTIVEMNPLAISNAGGSKPHTNVQPSLAINYIIALNGNYPFRD